VTVTAIAIGSKKDADMEISIAKTKCMHIKDQGARPKVSRGEAKAQAKFECHNIGCKHIFNNVHGMKIHAGTCKHKDVFWADRILDV
jgi:hypothetical protein